MTPIAYLRLPSRVNRMLSAVKLETVEQLSGLTESEVLRVPQLGRKTLKAIQNVLALNGRALRTEGSPESPEALALKTGRIWGYQQLLELSLAERSKGR